MGESYLLRTKKWNMHNRFMVMMMMRRWMQRDTWRYVAVLQEGETLRVVLSGVVGE